MSSFLEAIGLMPKSDHSTVIEGDRKAIARLKWAFNGDDKDSYAVKKFVAGYEVLVNEMSSDEHIMCSRKIADEIYKAVEQMRKSADALIDMAAVRLAAEGRWFTDEGGPDYTPPSAANPTDN